ncbi:MAG: ribosome silencing factor [Alphaproteobacteria bacterium]
MNPALKTKPTKFSNYLENLKASIIESLEASKAEDIVTIDLSDKTDFANLMIIASGRVNKHVDAISMRLVDDLENENIFDVQVEGREEANWILIDVGDIIVNIFKPDVREFYNLEKMWNVEFPASSKIF